MVVWCPWRPTPLFSSQQHMGLPLLFLHPLLPFRSPIDQWYPRPTPLSFVALSLICRFIRFSECFRVRVWDTIPSPKTLPYFPLRHCDVSSSTHVGLIDSVSKVVTSSSLTTFSSNIIFSFYLWPCWVTCTYRPGGFYFFGAIFYPMGPLTYFFTQF